MKTKLIIVIYFAIINLFCEAQHINGITMVATPSAFPSDPYPRMQRTNANWACLVPYGFTRLGQKEVWYNLENQWWGERTEGVLENIKLAKEQGIKVFLKPQVYIPGSWPGDLDFDKEADWQAWEENYTSFIMAFVDIAIEYDVEMFCIGTEFKISETKRPHYWKQLISDIRCKYIGLLTYSSNWDSFEQISFWKDLDYVGISSYFPLHDADEPSVAKLKREWKPYVNRLRKYSKDLEKQILFTECGYLSVDGCAGKTWELEKKVQRLDVNEQAQANAFDALYGTMWEEEFWAGGFIWKWFPHGQGHEGYVERDYTPQGKLAEKVIREWFGRDVFEW